MKKFVAIVLTLSLFLAIGAVASVAYVNSNADWGITAEIQADGSVNIGYDVEKVHADQAGWNIVDAQIAIYDTNPNFTSDSYMADFEDTPDKPQGKYPFTDSVAGIGDKGQVENGLYNVKVGEFSKDTASYPFVDGTTYYIYVCVNNANNIAEWAWNYVPCVLTYEAPAADDEIVTGNNGYPCTNADFGVTTEVQADGSVIIGASREAINAAAVAGGLTWGGNDFVANYIYITIYDEDPGFDSNTHMTNEGPYSTPAAGNDASGAGRVDGDPFTYRITQGAADSSVPAYPFVEGQTYYVYICVNNASNAGQWLWNYEGTSFVYEIPGEEPTPTPTATATATPTATATEGATETAATTEAATTEAAATTAAAETTAAATGTQSTDNTDDGGDFSVLIYLAAALVAGGGAAFAFRKKNRA